MSPLGAVKKFLLNRNPQGTTLLIGCSGGADSRALVHALWKVSPEWDLCLHVAHVDHGWRDESAEEARLLQEWIASKGLPFHQTRLAIKPSRNMEAGGRTARLHFFQKICQQIGAHAVCLGHHADDLIETVLKRVLEGAALHQLHGLREEHVLEGLCLWRPLLACTRAEIEQYCMRQKLPFFQDPTNEDSRWLRGRMRKEILPTLEKLFGKGIRRPLHMLGKRSQALETAFEQNLPVTPSLCSLGALRASLGREKQPSVRPISKTDEQD